MGGEDRQLARAMPGRGRAYRAALICCALVAAAPAPAAALTAALGTWHAPHQRALATRSLILPAADKKSGIKSWDDVEKAVPACSGGADWSDPAIWEQVQTCLEQRQRDPFSEPGPAPLARARSRVARGQSVSDRTLMEELSNEKRGKVSESVPLTAPPTLEEQSEADKARTLRSFENQERLDVERDLRDLLRPQ